MHDLAARLPGSLLSVDADLDREFEARLVESSTLAFRVAYGVLRHRQDAEDVAQEAFVKAYRSFRQLRDRDRFRAWLVRLTWRLAIDRRRNDRRREARDQASSEVRQADSSGARGSSREIETRLVENERAVQLWQAIDQLPDKLRIVVIL